MSKAIDRWLDRGTDCNVARRTRQKPEFSTPSGYGTWSIYRLGRVDKCQNLDELLILVSLPTPKPAVLGHQGDQHGPLINR